MRVAPGFSEDPVLTYRYDRNMAELPRYADIERAASSDFQDIVSRFQAGAIDRRAATLEFKERLQQAETEAFVSGRRARGVASAEITEAEAAMLTGRHSRNMRYFNGFLDDLEGGKYSSGRNGPMTPAKRADLYAKSLWSVYSRGETQDWAEPENVNARYIWVMDPDAEHCRDCLKRAGESRNSGGFTWEQLVEIGFPGEGTECRVHCRCHIRTVNKRTLIPEKLEELEPSTDPEIGVEKLITTLGGPTLPVRMPAAGIPSVGLPPETLEASIVGAGAKAPELGKLMPIVPKVLAKPAIVLELPSPGTIAPAAAAAGILYPSPAGPPSLPRQAIVTPSPGQSVSIATPAAASWMAPDSPLRMYSGEGLTMYAGLDMSGRWQLLLILFGPPTILPFFHNYRA